MYNKIIQLSQNKKYHLSKTIKSLIDRQTDQQGEALLCQALQTLQQPVWSVRCVTVAFPSQTHIML